MKGETTQEWLVLSFFLSPGSKGFTGNHILSHLAMPPFKGAGATPGWGHVMCNFNLVIYELQCVGQECFKMKKSGSEEQNRKSKALCLGWDRWLLALVTGKYLSN